MVEHALGAQCRVGRCFLPQGVTGGRVDRAPVYFVHVSAKQGLEAIQEARAKGMPVYGETLHNYCCFSSDNYREENGMKYHTYPALKSEEDRLSLWDGIVRGGLNTMATDEYCTSWETQDRWQDHIRRHRRPQRRRDPGGHQLQRRSLQTRNVTAAVR